jgi:hypothetical protein
MKSLVILLILSAAAYASVPTDPSFCADGDTACSCPSCGDQPNPYDIGLQPTLDYAALQGITGADDPNRYLCDVTFQGHVHCSSYGTFLGHTYWVSCDFSAGEDGDDTCHSGID